MKKVKTKVQIAEVLLEDLLEIKRVGLKYTGICYHVHRLCSLTHDEERLKSYLRDAMRDWPLVDEVGDFPIRVMGESSGAQEQFNLVAYSRLRRVCAPDYKAEYLGLRWHLLHHCILYVEDLIDELKQEQQQ